MSKTLKKTVFLRVGGTDMKYDGGLGRQAYSALRILGASAAEPTPSNPGELVLAIELEIEEAALHPIVAAVLKVNEDKTPKPTIDVVHKGRAQSVAAKALRSQP